MNGHEDHPTTDDESSSRVNLAPFSIVSYLEFVHLIQFLLYVVPIQSCLVSRILHMRVASGPHCKLQVFILV